MRLFHDLDYGFFTAVRGGSAPLRRISFKAGDATTLEVEFFRAGVAYVPASFDEAIFVIKDSYAPDAAPLALIPTEDWVADSDSDEESEIYTAALNLNTEEIREALASSASVTLKAELTVTLDGLGPDTSATVPCVVHNDLWKGEEGTPLPLPTPEEWLREQLTPYDFGTVELGEEEQAVLTLDANNGREQRGILTGNTLLDTPDNGLEGMGMTVSFYTTSALNLNLSGSFEIPNDAAELLPIELESNRSYVLKLHYVGYLWTVQEIYGPTQID